ncbi:MAG: FecR domain-containing protein [Lentisphaeraceae bacterium]|nr:FecR domain-containing protein [Lentisphaeraceae bacterium]
MNEDLFDKYLNDSLSDQEAEELKTLLEDPKVGEEFVKYTFETKLIADMAQRQATIPKKKRVPKKKKHFSKPVFFFLAAAAAVLFFLNTLPQVTIQNKGDFHKEGGSVLSSLRQSSEIFEGDKLTALRDTELSLPDGTVLVFRDGAEVTFQSLGEATHLVLNEGNVHFKVQPQKHDFIISLPDFDIEVVGTEFLVEVNSGFSSVEMIEGEVLIKKEAESFPLSETDVLVQRHGGMHLVGPRENLSYYKWSAWSEMMKESQDTLIYLDMDENFHTHNKSMKAKLISGKYSSGRVKGKKSLENGVIEIRDSAKVDLGDEYTVFAWVNFSESIYYSPIITKGDSALRLQLDDSKIHIGYGENESRSFFTANKLMEPMKWHFVAATVNARSAKLFINGHKVGEEPVKNPILNNTKRIMVGASSGIPSRTFVGRIGEVGLLKKAYSESQISELFELSNFSK